MLRPPLRTTAAAAALALTGGLLAATPTLAAPAADPITLRSAELTVTVGAEFPRVISYADKAPARPSAGSRTRSAR